MEILKAKLKEENSEVVSATTQLVSVTTQLKLLASDGKRYKSDMRYLSVEGLLS